MSHLKTEAIVLKSIDWKDSSRIVTLFTREKGKISVIAKGARRANSQYQGILESINRIEASVYFSDTRQIQILGQVDLEDGFQKLKADYYKTAYAFAVLEITDTFFQKGAADPVFFDFLTTLLAELELSHNTPVIFWYFLLKMASYLGFRPDFEVCKICSENKGDQTVRFSVRDGAVICQSCGAESIEGWTISPAVRHFLIHLQKRNHKNLSGQVFSPPGDFPYTDFLVTYLKHHSEENLKMTALKMLK